MWPAASAITDRRAPGSTDTRARSVPVSRAQPPRLGSGTTSSQSLSRSPASAVTVTGVPGGTRAGSMTSETLRSSPGCRRTGDCLKRSAPTSATSGAEPAGDGSADAPFSTPGSGSTRAAASAGAPPRSKPAVPGASKALRSASLSARSPTWSRAWTARPARTRCAPARRSSAATIGRSTRSIAALRRCTNGWCSLSPERSTLTTTWGRGDSSAARWSCSSSSQITSP